MKIKNDWGVKLLTIPIRNKFNFIKTNHYSYPLPQLLHDGNVSRSSLVLRPSAADHGTYVACRARNPLLPQAVLEDLRRLNVHCKWGRREAKVIVLKVKNSNIFT